MMSATNLHRTTAQSLGALLKSARDIIPPSLKLWRAGGEAITVIGVNE
jgi:hypothetical protein